ncbi:MAG: hypothetical protein L0027_05530 [Candidatus Rokubacteria bacterium]|nr:hypothetical protein [Candidatus Rokubacteria bacterium]
MKRILVLTAAVATLTLTGSGQAATVIDVQLNGNALADFSGAGVLAADPTFVNTAPIVIAVAPDADPLAFNSLVDFLLDNGAAGMRLALGGGATWELVGSVVPITASGFELTQSDTEVALRFADPEFVGVDLGDVGDGGVSWLIDVSNVGESFTVTVQALTVQTVSQPASLALLGAALLVVGAFVARRRVATAAPTA